jgi:hypothetical protein
MMMDELRDYRFYEADMLRPNDLAVNIIWDKFKTVWIAEDTSITMDDIDMVQKG